jgi:predicted flap endonuclease-1-like 5' DNA nuclease
MDTLKRFLCDWGSPDSNMLLFFLFTSFLLGLLTGWLMWGRKIQAMLNQVGERDATITDLNAKLTLKEEELGKANKSTEELLLRNRTLSEEKGQLHANVMAANSEIETLKLAASAAAISVPMAAAVVAPTAIVAPEIELEIATDDDNDSLIDILETEPEEEIIAAEPQIAVEDIVAAEAIAEVAAEEITISEPIAEEVTAIEETQATEEASAESEAATNEGEEMSASAVISPDDLKVVEGIGPKIEALLNDAGIMTFKQLSEATTEHLNEVLAAAGRRYQIHDPSTWARQALMAFDGQWDELKVWQDNLKGGKE